MRIALPAAATVLALSLAAPAAATTVLFPPAGSNSFIALYETDSGNQICDITCTLVASPTRTVDLAPTTFSTPPFNFINAGGSVTPTALRGFVNSGSDAAVLDLAFRDTYTVVGAGTDPFNVTARMHVTGSLGARQVGNTALFQSISSIIGTIGEFRIDPVFDLVPTVAAFSPSTRNSTFVNRIQTGDFTVPVEFDVTYTRTVRPGDIFDLGWMLNGNVTFRGSADFQNTGVISFDTPDGVYLTAASGAQFGDVPAAGVPEPAAWGLMIMGFGLAGATLRARRLRMA